MPTKLGKGGHGEQNYVPSGNGDASGEYGDNATGSNIHFTNFKKPDEPKAEEPKEETPIETKAQEDEPIETKQEEPKSRLDELSKKQKEKIGNYVYGRDLDNYSDRQRQMLIDNLRYYKGTFGDLSNFTDDELWDIANEFKNLEESQDYVYIKKGSKWYLSKRTGLMDKQGIQYYTKEQKEELEKAKNKKLFENSQSETDKKIQSLMGKQCVVCFGKGYSEEDTKEIYDATKTLITDYPELANYVARIGDRNNLEKYINAINSQKTFTEEEIKAQIEKERSRYYFGAPSEEELRATAIKRLQGSVSFTRMNNAYAYWSNSDRMMLFMGKMKKKLEEQNEYEYQINFKSSNKKISTYYHEMGHAIDYMVDKLYKDKIDALKGDYQAQSDVRIKYDTFRRELKDLISQNFNQKFSIYALRDEFEKRYGYAYKYGSYQDELRFETLKKELRDSGEKEYNVSRYGATNDKEFVAECYSAYYTNMNNQLANKAVKLFQDIYKYLRG